MNFLCYQHAMGKILKIRFSRQFYKNKKPKKIYKNNKFAKPWFDSENKI